MARRSRPVSRLRRPLPDAAQPFVGVPVRAARPGGLPYDMRGREPRHGNGDLPRGGATRGRPVTAGAGTLGCGAPASAVTAAATARPEPAALLAAAAVVAPDPAAAPSVAATP